MIFFVLLAFKAVVPSASSDDDASTLRRVVVLSRHGTKVPKQDALDACPGLAPIYASFAREQLALPNSLTPAGIEQLAAAGRWARERYIYTLQRLPGTFFLNASSTFTAQRSPFCIQSTSTFARAMYPDGNGPKLDSQYGLPQRPEIVPINVPFGQPSTDTLLNCAGDGVCYDKWSAVKSHWVQENGEQFIRRHKPALDSLSKACGQQIFTENATKWQFEIFKDITDGLQWTHDSGLDDSFGGQLTSADIDGLQAAAFELLKECWVGDGSKALTACNFPKQLLTSLSTPSTPTSPVTFEFYLNHRELVYAVLDAFQLSLPDIPGEYAGHVNCGTTLFFELHQQDDEIPYVKVILFTATGQNSFGTFDLLPQFCNSTSCSLSAYQDVYSRFAQDYGTVESLCLTTESDAESLIISDVESPHSLALLFVPACLLLSIAAYFWRYKSAYSGTGYSELQD